MSSDVSSAAGQGSRLHRRESRTPMQATKLPEPPELEESSSLAKTALTRVLVLASIIIALSSWMLEEKALAALWLVMTMVLVLTIQSRRWRGILLVVLALLVLVVLMLVELYMFPLWWEDVVVVVVHMFPLWWKDVLVLVVLRLTLERVLNSWTARMHGHAAKRLRKWGPHEWVLDSGAWIHHTSKLELLIEVEYFQEMDNEDAPSTSGNAYAQGRGSIRTGSFDFPGVHYVVADDTRNVVSVSQLARDHGLVTFFKPTSCHVKVKKTGHIIGKGRLHDGVYMLDFLRINGQVYS